MKRALLLYRLGPWTTPTPNQALFHDGLVAEWLRRGLQKLTFRARQFEHLIAKSNSWLDTRVQSPDYCCHILTEEMQGPAGLSLHAFNAVLELISRDVSEGCQINTLRTLMFVGRRQGCTQKDVEEHLKTSNATTSRNVSYWTDRRLDRQAGVGFIDRVPDDHDRRMRILVLTKSGQAFYDGFRVTQ